MTIRSFVPSSARRICGILVGLVLAPAAIGQTTITAPYNPDSDADSVIAILDLMSVLSIYGDAFEPAPIMIDGITLEAYINELQEAADAATGDTVFIPSIIPGSAKGQMLFWGGTAWELLDPGEPGEMLQVGDDAMPRWEVPSPEACVVGCQDASACNYNALAKVTFVGACDYVSCLGCTDSLYLEFDPEATQDDGSCQILAVPGCTDDQAMNYDYTANLDDGSCIPYFYEGCGNVEAVDFEGYSYELITIAGRCWFAENLLTAHYSNGDPIPSGTEEDWAAGLQGLQTVYGQMDVDCNNSCDPVSNLANYGRLYNGYAVQDGRGLCPTGFEVASDSAWMELEFHLGMTDEELFLTEQSRNPEVANKLKSSPFEEVLWDGNNQSGMTLVPGGANSASDQVYKYEGDAGFFWSPGVEETSGFTMRRSILSGDYGVHRAERSSMGGYSVRCVHIPE